MGGALATRAHLLRIAGRPVTLSFAASAAIQGLNVLTGVLLARTLGPHGRGELAAALLWPAVIGAVGSLGVFEATTFHAARRTAPEGTLLGTALALALAQSALCVAAGILIVPRVLAQYDAETLRATYILLAWIPLNLVALTLMSLLNGMQRFGQFHALRLAVIGATGAGIVALRAADALTVQNVAMVYVATTAATGAAAAVLVARARLSRLAVDLPLARRLLAFGVKSHSGSVSWMMNERLDQLVISVFLAPARLGLYVMAVTLTSLTNLVGSSAATAAFPVVARMSPGAARADAVRRYVRLSLLASVAVSVPLIVLAPAVIDVFFKDPYHGATNVARVLLVAGVVLSTNRVVGACVKALDRPLDAGIAEFVALGVTVAGLAALLPALGIMGAAVVSLVAYAVSTAWMLRPLARALGVSLPDLLLPERGRPRLFRPRRPAPEPVLEATTR